ncbi:MAG: trimethylamine methyltransferase family protein [Candidatus Thorarchaeota archaeon]|jgi:trimethylamine--corrinoid protein Co-methyltransferase
MITLRFLSQDDLNSIQHATFVVLEKTGVAVKNETTLKLLHDAGCVVEDRQVRIPHSLVEESIRKAPSSFDLYTRDGNIACTIGTDNVVFNPGSSGVYFKDRKTREIRKGTLNDCIELVQLVENLEHIKAQSTALVPSDVPEHLSGLYRLYVILKHSMKPIVTGAFRKEGVGNMKLLLESVVGGSKELSHKPRAIFDCCPTSPLTWDDVSLQHLIDCSASGIPAAIVPAPLLGATGPITIHGTLVQSCAEILSGVVISQLVKPGAPVIFGGATGSFDMRYATPRFNAVEAMLAACASSEIGRHFELPTHAYLGTSDAKTEDSQSGFESGIGVVLAALSRINVVSGPGMLTQLNCQSLEKLVIDNELCGSALRFSRGLDFEDVGLVTDLISKVGSGGNYLGQKHTSKKLRSEHFMPSDVICRLTADSWIEGGSKTAFDRAHEKVNAILKDHSSVYPEQVDELEKTFEDIQRNYSSLAH